MADMRLKGKHGNIDMADHSNKPDTTTRPAYRPGAPRPARSTRPAALAPSTGTPFLKNARAFVRYALVNIRNSRTFTRESIIGWLKSLAWIAPLTILIWVYAEREQQDIQKDQTIPIEVTIQDPNRVVRLQDSRDENVMAELRGSRFRLDDVKRQLIPREGSGRLQLTVDKDLSPGQYHEIILQPLLAEQSIFKDNGITVSNPQPSRLRVFIDEIQEIDAIVEASPASMASLDGVPIFTPAKVKLSAPREKIQQYEREHTQMVVYADLLAKGQELQPGSLELKGVPLLSPFPDARVRITPSVVDAKVQVKEADLTYQMPGMTVWLVGTRDFMQRYRVNYDTILQDPVTLVGPPRIIDAIRNESYTPKPKALLEVTINDIPGKEYTRTLKFDLPPGVNVAEEDAKRSITFTVEEITSGR